MVSKLIYKMTVPRKLWYLAYFSFTSPLKIINLIKVRLSFLLKRKKVWGYPPIVKIEPTNYCNLKCPLCPTGAGILPRVKGFASFENAKKIIDEIGKYTIYLRMYGMGEPLLNKELFDIIKYAKKKNMFVSFHSNSHFMNEKNAKKIVESGLDELSISLDGASPETYPKYRLGGKFEDVLIAINTMVSEKKNNKKKTPYIRLQFIIMRHNEHEVEKIKKIAKDSGVDKLVLKAVTADKTINKDADKYVPKNPEYRKYDLDENNVIIKKPTFCVAPWEEMTIGWDGRVYVCCFDLMKLKDFTYVNGNVFESGIKKIWNSQGYEKFRTSLIKNKKEPICQNCAGFKTYFRF